MGKNKEILMYSKNDEFENNLCAISIANGVTGCAGEELGRCSNSRTK